MHWLHSRKLALAQSQVSPVLASRISATADDIDALDAHIPCDASRYRQIIEQLGLAISESRVVDLHYFSQHSAGEKVYPVFPITLEPHFEGRSVYLFSWMFSSAGGGFRTLNVEHILSGRSRCIKTRHP